MESAVLDSVVLLVSELATNAVLHGRRHPADAGQILVSVDVDDDRARIEVHDSSTSLPVMGDGALHKPSGRGLVLVAALADAWGAECTADGKVVWFEIALRGPRATRPEGASAAGIAGDG